MLLLGTVSLQLLFQLIGQDLHFAVQLGRDGLVLGHRVTILLLGDLVILQGLVQCALLVLEFLDLCKVCANVLDTLLVIDVEFKDGFDFLRVSRHLFFLLSFG